MKKLRPRLEPLVVEKGLAWDDVVPALELIDTVEEIEAAASDPAAFLSKLTSTAGPVALKLAVKKLQFDKERADEKYEEADREATDLAEWIAFARTHNASENELMSFVKAFGDELLGDMDVSSMDPGMVEIEELAGRRKSKSSAVVLGSTLAQCCGCHPECQAQRDQRRARARLRCRCNYG